MCFLGGENNLKAEDPSCSLSGRLDIERERSGVFSDSLRASDGRAGSGLSDSGGGVGGKRFLSSGGSDLWRSRRPRSGLTSFVAAYDNAPGSLSSLCQLLTVIFLPKGVQPSFEEDAATNRALPRKSRVPIFLVLAW